jgi:hypothetical protein
MPKKLRALALGVALALTPAGAACTSLSAKVENPLAAARTPDQAAFALLQTYASVLEEATDLVQRPNVPIEVKRALGAAESAATPALDLTRIAVVAYLRARADYESARDRPSLERAAAGLAIAGVRLEEAMRAARQPLGALQDAVRRQAKERKAQP